MEFKLDNTDKKILTFLCKNAKMPYHEIATECKLSTGAVHKRVEKLENAGIIKGYRAELDTEAVGYGTRAFVGVMLERASMYSSVKTSLSKIPQVIEAHFTTGHFGLLLKIYCRDNLHLKDILTEMHTIPGISSTETFISIEQPIAKTLSLKLKDE